MCGRFALRTSVPELARLLGAEPPLPELAPRYNVAPTDSSVVCVAGAEGARRLVVMRWGLLPHWAKDRSFGARAINARAETVADKPAFRAAFRRRRCLVPVDGYYEWRAARPVKQPYFVHLEGHGPFLLAGLWSSWESPEGERLDTFAIITTDAEARIAEVHDRMPVVMPDSAVSPWLDPGNDDPDALRALLVPDRAAPLALYPVSTFVNKAGNDDARCVEPLIEPPLQTG